MGQIDKIKEFIGALKVYLAVITAMLIADIGGTVKLFLNGETGMPFWFGIISIMVLAFLFAAIAKFMHKKIDQLEDM